MLYIRQLPDAKKKAFITHLNALFLSRNSDTRPIGIYLQHQLSPFLFSNFLIFKNLNDTIEDVEYSLNTDRFAEFIENEKTKLLQFVLCDIVFRDILIRYNIKTLQNFNKFCSDTFG